MKFPYTWIMCASLFVAVFMCANYMVSTYGPMGSETEAETSLPVRQMGLYESFALDGCREWRHGQSYPQPMDDAECADEFARYMHEQQARDYVYGGNQPFICDSQPPGEDPFRDEQWREDHCAYMEEEE